VTQESRTHGLPRVDPHRNVATVASSPAAVAAALAVVYVVWGSTYYAIRVAIDTMPPLLMAAVRFTIAGGLLFGLAATRGDRHADPIRAVHWRSALIIGVAMLSIGNGGVTIGEDYVPTGIAALLVATVPLWMAVFAHVFAGERVRRLTIVGIAIGLFGVALLIRPGANGGAAPVAMLALLIAPLSWAGGSVYARSAVLPARPLVATGMEMLTGGAVLFIAAAAHGEFGEVHLQALSARSVAAFFYLVVFGSIVAFSAYIWLLNHTSTSLVSTYAYVNPLVAVLLGWWLLSESISAQTLVAAGVIVAAVALIMHRSTPSAAPPIEVPSDGPTRAITPRDEASLCQSGGGR
jgi:drug/metabolite transporter (DMT)-like permease